MFLGSLSIASLSLGFDLACGCAVGLALLDAFSLVPVVAVGCILACVTLRSICIFNTGALNSIKDGKGCCMLTLMMLFSHSNSILRNVCINTDFPTFMFI